MKKALKNRIYHYLTRKSTWVNGGEIERLALSVGYKSSNASRRLRELHEEGLLDRRLNEKGHVEYKVGISGAPVKKPTFIYEGNTVKIIYR